MKVRDVIGAWRRTDGTVKAKGGHRQFKHSVKSGRITVSGQPNVDVPIKTLKSIWKQAQLPEEE